MSRVWVTGYRSYELSVFNDKDPKLTIIKHSLSEELSKMIENGVDWFITGAQTGAEQWTVEVANELKKKYPDEFKIAVMLPFKDFGKNWNENNQAKLARTKSLADFTGMVSDNPYESPKQLKNYQQFMLNHTDEALLLYDTDNKGKTKFDLASIESYEKHHAYPYHLIDFDELQDMAEDYQEQLNDDF